jgi:hypothetical protein
MLFLLDSLGKTPTGLCKIKFENSISELFFNRNARARSRATSRARPMLP